TAARWTASPSGTRERSHTRRAAAAALLAHSYRLAPRARLDGRRRFDPRRARRGDEDAAVPVVPAHAQPRGRRRQHLLDGACARRLSGPLRFDTDPVADVDGQEAPPSDQPVDTPTLVDRPPKV